jgi:hypothetical protein
MNDCRLSRFEMSETFRALYHKELEKTQGRFVARIKAAALPPITSSVLRLAVTAADRSKSVRELCCAKCQRFVGDPTHRRAFDLEGQLSFYMCHDCLDKASHKKGSFKG